MSKNRFQSMNKEYKTNFKNIYDYSNKIRIKIKQLNDNVSKKSNLLPNIYTKANEINRKLNFLNDQNYHSPLSINFQNEKEKEVFLKAYKKRKRSIVVSKYLDENMQLKLEQIKNSDNPSRRQSIFDFGGKNCSSTNQQDSFPIEKNNESANELFNKKLKFSDDSDKTNKILSPRFGSTLSKNGQLALIKSLEDTIVKEIEQTYPDLKDKIPRTSTAQFCRSLIDSTTMSDFNSLNNQFLSNEFQYLEESELFNAFENKETESNKQLKKKLIVTQQINDGMDILDNIRLDKINFQSKKSPANKKVNYLEKQANLNNNIKSFFNQRLNSNKCYESSNENVISIEPLAKYSEWKSVWIKQLENI